MTLDIGEVTAASGLPPSTLHVWERNGLIESVGRNGLRRQYDEAVLTRIAMIVAAQRAGFTHDEIRTVFEDGGIDRERTPLHAKLDELRARRAELDAAITSLEHALECDYPSPLECPGFLGWLDGVLPVDRA